MNIGGNLLGKYVVSLSCETMHHTSIQKENLSHIYLEQNEVPHFNNFVLVNIQFHIHIRLSNWCVRSTSGPVTYSNKHLSLLMFCQGVP